MFRNAAGVILYAYLPVFFLSNFPNYRTQFSTLNAVTLSLVGFIASIFEGIISDRFERISFWTKPIINMTQMICAIPIIACGTLFTGNFYFSLLCYATKILLCGSNSGPSITMLQKCVGSKLQG